MTIFRSVSIDLPRRGYSRIALTLPNITQRPGNPPVAPSLSARISTHAPSPAKEAEIDLAQRPLSQCPNPVGNLDFDQLGATIC